jgi:hypothetical protein
MPFVFRKLHALVGMTLCLGLGAEAGSGSPGLANLRHASLSSVLGAASAKNTLVSSITTTYTETPAFSEAFVNSIGINTDFAYWDTIYGTQFPAVASLLVHLGVKHIRDATDTNEVSDIADIARYGVHEDVVASASATPASVISYIAALPKGTVDAVEGLNEWDLSGDPNWAADDYSYQSALYTALKASPITSGIPVLAPSFSTYQAAVAAWPHAAYEDIADYGNTHDYFGANYPGRVGTGGPYAGYGMYGTLPFWLALAAYDVGPKPIVSTETGYTDGDTYPPNSGAVSDSIKARYTMRTLLLSWNQGVQRTYLYQLVDVLGQNFGLVTGGLKVKPAYTAVQNLITDLDSSVPAPVPTPVTYSLTVANGATTIAHTLLQRSASSYHLFVWDEVAAQDPLVPSAEVTITFTKRYSAIYFYRWNDDGSVTAQFLPTSAQNSVTFKATDRVSEIRMYV